MIQNSRNESALSQYDKFKPNADGSIDIYLGSGGAPEPSP